MYESITVVGARGQITIPKNIRDKEHLKPKDKVIVKIENNKLIVEKIVSKDELKKKLEIGYKKFTKLSQELDKEFKHATIEADEMLDDY